MAQALGGNIRFWLKGYLFLGVAVREAGLTYFNNLVENVLLYGATLFLGLVLGILCSAELLLDPRILKLLILGITALLLSGIGGILGGYAMYFFTGGRYNPAVGIGAVSCVLAWQPAGHLAELVVK